MSENLKDKKELAMHRSGRKHFPKDILNRKELDMFVKQQKRPSIIIYMSLSKLFTFSKPHFLYIHKTQMTLNPVVFLKIEGSIGLIYPPPSTAPQSYA